MHLVTCLLVSWCLAVRQAHHTEQRRSAERLVVSEVKPSRRSGKKIGVKDMKRSVVIMACVSLMLGIVGCQQNAQSPKGPSKANVAAGGGEFPKSLAGTWECAEEGLEIVLEPNGVIASAIMPFGKLQMRSGETIEINRPEVKYKAVFEAGAWSVNYEPATGELTVELSLAHYRAEIADNVLEGETRDIFSGKVSQDAGIWEAEWFSFHTAKDLDFLAMDPTNSTMPDVIFRKTASFHH